MYRLLTNNNPLCGKFAGKLKKERKIRWKFAGKLKKKGKYDV